MFVAITVIFIYTIRVQSHLQDNINLRADCYRSFSDPVVFIKLLHYYPSGPLALSAIFIYERYNLLEGFTPESVTARYDFSRYDFPCNTSTFFTTGGFFFNFMVININIYLLGEEILMSGIGYIFYRGFRPGEYKLLDNNQNFAVQLKILNIKEKYLETQRKLPEIFKIYVESISDTKGELCIITINNRATIVKFKEGTVLPGGYIYSLSAYNYPYNIGDIYTNHAAFLCQTHEKYYEERVIFITEKNKTKKSFGIIYLKSYINDVANFNRMKIEIMNPTFESIYNLKKIIPIYNKIFLFHHFFGPISKNCSDGSMTTSLLFGDNVEFLTYMCKFVRITNDIKVYARFISSPSDPSGQVKY